MLDIQMTAWLEPASMLIVSLILIFLSPRLVRLLVSYSLNYRQRSDKKSLQTQITQFRRELSSISQTDEFAKYSKVQRKLRATTDQLNNIARKDLELNFKYVLVGQAFAWMVAFLICLKLIYQLYHFVLSSIGYGV